MHPARGPQQPSPLREKMHELVDAARNRPETPTGMPADLSQSERLEKRIESVETRAATVASNFDTLTTNMQSRLELGAERAAANGNQERADNITGMAETLATRIETVSDRVNSHFEANLDRALGLGKGGQERRGCFPCPELRKRRYNRWRYLGEGRGCLCHNI